MTIDDPPPTLFMLGAWKPVYERAVAMVGTREPGSEAAALASQLGARLAQAGITVVSGLARGIDTAAHQGALSVAGGQTVAVLGCGVLNLYPPENQALIPWRTGRGLLLSETAPDAPPSSARLVARNRLISGLAVR